MNHQGSINAEDILSVRKINKRVAAIFMPHRYDWHIYLIRCHDGSLYTGITTNVARRFAEHLGNGDTGAKYLRGRKPLVLVFQKKLGSRSLALGVENKVKKLSKARKEELIRAHNRLDEIVKQVESQLTA